MPYPRDAAGLWHTCALSWVCGKNIKKLYGKKLLQSIMFSTKKLQNQILNQFNILKNKINKENFGNNHKKNERKKNYTGKHCSNL
jgi:hypothetical protein